MANYNKVLLMGNLTRDPEQRYTPKGIAVCQLGLAVNRVWKDEDGQDKEEVLFVDIDVFGRQAETAGKYLSKGRPVFIEGRLRLDTWDDRESGQKRSRMKVVAERIVFLGAPKNVEFQEEPPASQPQRRAQTPQAPAPARAPEEEPPPAEEGGDEIPF